MHVPSWQRNSKELQPAIDRTKRIIPIGLMNHREIILTQIFTKFLLSSYNSWQLTIFTTVWYQFLTWLTIISPLSLFFGRISVKRTYIYHVLKNKLINKSINWCSIMAGKVILLRKKIHALKILTCAFAQLGRFIRPVPTIIICITFSTSINTTPITTGEFIGRTVRRC